MPWKETCVVDERTRFVMEVEQGRFSKAGLCRMYGISRVTGQKWLGRYAEGGLTALADMSRAPRCHPNEVGKELAELILGMRRQYPHWGPRKLKLLLQRRYSGIDWPAASTIGDLLKRHGLTSSRKFRRRNPPYSRPFAACDGSNAVWCADFKGWFRTGDGDRCDPLTISDAYSRYLLRCQAMTDTGYEAARGLFEAVFRQYGLPLAIRTDNGCPFASCGLAGLSRLSVWWMKLGIVPERIELGHPEQNGRHERMHLTLKQETASPASGNLRRQQESFDAFRLRFNQDRPHEALGGRCPGEVYSASVRAYPERLAAAEYPETMAVRTVKSNGAFCWRNRMVFLGEAFAGERVGLSAASDGVWTIYFCRTALGTVDQRRLKVIPLDPTGKSGMAPAGDGCQAPSATLQGLGNKPEESRNV